MWCSLFCTAAWIAIRRVFVDLSIKGCIFHWTQAIWRKVQDQGLATTYRMREAAHDYLRKLMALPFLPAAHIRPTFDKLRNKANTDPLKEVTSYINRQWIESSVFDIPSWSVFRQTVRTNNDVEGMLSYWYSKRNATKRQRTVLKYFAIFTTVAHSLVPGEMPR